MLDLIEESDWGVQGAKPPEKKIAILACKFLVPTHDHIYGSAILLEKIILSRVGGFIYPFLKI